MKQRILITGLSGYIGSRFAQMLSDAYDIVDVDCDILYAKGVSEAVTNSKCDVVLHLAGKTHIDRCQRDKIRGKKGIVWLTNVEGTAFIVDACERYHKYLIYLSTECVFDGKTGWHVEDDVPSPKNWYGTTKCFAEGEIVDRFPNASILRSVLAYGHPASFPHDMVSMTADRVRQKRRLCAVFDQVINPTFIDDLIGVIDVFIQQRPRGVFHYAGLQSLSPYAFVRMLCRHMGYDERLLVPVSLKEYFGNRAPLRLMFSTLSCSRISRELGIIPSDLERSFHLLKKRIV